MAILIPTEGLAVQLETVDPPVVPIQMVELADQAGLTVMMLAMPEIHVNQIMIAKDSHFVAEMFAPISQQMNIIAVHAAQLAQLRLRSAGQESAHALFQQHYAAPTHALTQPVMSQIVEDVAMYATWDKHVKMVNVLSKFCHIIFN